MFLHKLWTIFSLCAINQSINQSFEQVSLYLTDWPFFFFFKEVTYSAAAVTCTTFYW